VPGRIDAVLVCGGDYHDFDYARLRLLTLLADDERVRTTVHQDYEDVEALGSATFLLSYTCNVRPSIPAQQALRRWVQAGGRWFALHATNSFFDPPANLGQGVFRTPDACPDLTDVLGSRFCAHPAIEPYRVTVSPGAEADAMVAGIQPFETTDELYLSVLSAGVVPLLETRWTGSVVGFAEADWPDDEPRLVLYRRPLGAGEVLYLTLGHCRSTWDMTAPPFNGRRYPAIERGSWELDEYLLLLRRGIDWAKAAGTRGAP
jgi:uncharacterized protein